MIVANSANLFSYLFQFFMGRYLSIEDFGVLNSVNSLGVIAGAITGIIPYIVAKYIIEFKENEKMASLFVWNIFKFMFVITSLISLIIIIFIDNISNYLNLIDNIPIYIFLAAMTAGVFASIALFRFIAALILVGYLGYGYNGALFAAVIANVLISVWVYQIVNKKIKFYKPKNIKLPKDTYKKIFIYAFPVALMWLAIGILSNIDIILVKHYTNDIEAGEYSVAAIIGRIAVFLPSVLLAVLFPQVSQNSKDGKSSVSTIITVMMLTFILSGGFTLFVYLFPEFIITLLFGEKYLGGTEVLLIITITMALVAVLSVLFNYFLAKGIYSFLYFSWIIILGIGYEIIYYMNSNSMQIATTILYGTIVLVIINIFILFYHYYKERIISERDT